MIIQGIMFELPVVACIGFVTAIYFVTKMLSGRQVCDDCKESLEKPTEKTAD